MARTGRPAVCQSLRSGRCSLRRHLYPATFTCCYCPYVCLHLRPFPPAAGIHVAIGLSWYLGASPQQMRQLYGWLYTDAYR
jgi:hypothetical protein